MPDQRAKTVKKTSFGSLKINQAMWGFFFEHCACMVLIDVTVSKLEMNMGIAIVHIAQLISKVMF